MRLTLEDNPMRLIALNLILALALTLTACGGGDDDTTPPPETDTGNTETDTSGGDDTAVDDTGGGDDTAVDDTAVDDTGGGDDTAVEDTKAPPGPSPFDTVVEALTASCSGCHGGDDGCSYAAACFLDDVAVMSQPVLNSAACGDATDVAGCAVVRMNNLTMPQYGAPNPNPTTDQIQVLVDWITAGMPAE